jgi:hypothetical protein
MDFSTGSMALGLPLLIAVVWLYRINKAIKTVPTMAQKLSHRWSKEEMASTYERVKEKSTSLAGHIPPKLNRRYIVVGGSGMK